MTIKPTGGNSAGDVQHTPDDLAATAERVFSRKLDAAAVPDAPAGAEAAVATRFCKADLRDPQKADVVVRQVLRDMVDNDWGAASGISENDRNKLVDFMANDPAIRQQAERWLERVLK